MTRMCLEPIYKVKLADVCEILDNKRIPITASDRKTGIYPYYGANGVQDYVDGYIFDEDLVLLAEDGGNFGSKDKPIAYRVSGKCWVNNHAHVLRPLKNIDVDYLCYSLMFYDVNKLVNGATRKKLNKSEMLKMEVPLLELEEQRQIVKKIKRLENIIESRKKQVDLLDLLIKSRFIEMFGDPVTNPNQFPKVALSELADIKIGPFGSLLHKEDYIENGHPIVNPSHIIEGKIAIDTSLTISNKKYMELESYQLHVGDVVLGRRGEMGRCAVVLKNGLLCGTGSMIIRTKGEVTADFIQKIISFPTFRKSIENMSVGQTMPNLNVPIVSNFFVIKPPIEVQKEYYAFIDKIVKSKFTNYMSLLLLIIKKIWYNNYV